MAEEHFIVYVLRKRGRNRLCCQYKERDETKIGMLLKIFSFNELSEDLINSFIVNLVRHCFKNAIFHPCVDVLQQRRRKWTCTGHKTELAKRSAFL